MGQAIIDAISGGLGLMGDITSELLNGFTTLFWNTESSSLTTLGMFALIFLGVAITFAIVRLALSLIRGKTGL